MKYSKKNNLMRFFIYKTLFVFMCLIIAYKITIGNTINKLETEIEKIKSKESIERFKIKLRKEIAGSLDKERILNKEDAVLIKNFITKIKKELNN